VAPLEIRIGRIYLGILPFIAMRVIGIALLVAFPRLTLWLPDIMDRLHGS